MTPVQPAVSVVIPVFNCERYVAAAIDSVLAQTLPVDEIIVVDDGSSDGTPAALAAFADRITLITQPNRGGADASNRGVEAATGDVLNFLDADDLWTRDKVARQVAWLTAHPQTEAVFGHVQQFISPDLDAEAAARIECPASPQPGVCKSSMAIRRTAFARVGGFDGGMRSIDFLEWFTRALDCGLRTEVLPDVLTMRRLHGDNNGIRIRSSQIAENLLVLKRSLDRRRVKQAPPA